MKSFIKIGHDRYLMKDSNGVILSSEEILKMDAENCPKNKKNNKCKECEPKVDLKGELINEESIKLNNNK